MIGMGNIDPVMRRSSLYASSIFEYPNIDVVGPTIDDIPKSPKLGGFSHSLFFLSVMDILLIEQYAQGTKN